jgi:hypothetical protein
MDGAALFSKQALYARYYVVRDIHRGLQGNWIWTRRDTLRTLPLHSSNIRITLILNLIMADFVKKHTRELI